MGRSSQMVPSMIGDSMVLMGENTALMKRKNVKKTGASKRQRPLKLELSVDGPHKGEK